MVEFAVCEDFEDGRDERIGYCYKHAGRLINHYCDESLRRLSAQSCSPGCSRWKGTKESRDLLHTSGQWGRGRINGCSRKGQGSRQLHEAFGQVSLEEFTSRSLSFCSCVLMSKFSSL